MKLIAELSTARRFWGFVLKLFRIESERLKLSAPFWRRIAQSLDTDAAGQAAFHSCFDKIGREEGERDGHIDLPDAPWAFETSQLHRPRLGKMALANG